MFQEQVMNYARGVATYMAGYARKEFDLPDDWAPVVRTDFSTRRTRSWGGVRRIGNKGEMKPFMSLVSNITENDTTFNEYKRFEKDPDIGTFVGSKWQHHINALVAHELAHAIQYSVSKETIEELGLTEKDVKGHKALWRTIYRNLRKKFVNERDVLLAEFLYAVPTADEVQQGMYSFKDI